MLLILSLGNNDKRLYCCDDDLNTFVPHSLSKYLGPLASGKGTS